MLQLSGLCLTSALVNALWLHAPKTVAMASSQVLLAANVHNSEELLPHFILQLSHLLSVLPHGTAFLSIYESGSSDASGARRLYMLGKSCDASSVAT